MASPSFDSFSQNGEDVVLWRALQGVPHGRYIDVGANDPVIDSVSRAFYDRGWDGITVEPDPQYALSQREQRPRDIQVEAAITAADGGSVTLHVVDGTGLSTVKDDLRRMHAGTGHETHDIVVPTRRLDRVLEEAGWADHDIHFMSIDTEGSERAVLESIDLSVWRPWILVVEATVPTSTEQSHLPWDSLVTEAGYRFCLFDGLSRWYVAEEHVDRLLPALGYGASVVDNYTTLRARQSAEEIRRVQAAVDTALGDVVRWRAEALTRWATTVADSVLVANMRVELEAQRKELPDLRERLHDLDDEHNELLQVHHELSGEHHELSQLCHEFSQENALLKDLVSKIYGSTSWRITQPLRGAAGRIGQVRSKR